MSKADPHTKPAFETVGSNSAVAFGRDAKERATALAAQAGMVVDGSPSTGTVYYNLDYVCDPAWLGAIAKQPGALLVKDGVPVLLNTADAASAAPVLAAMERRESVDAGPFELIDADTADFSYSQLRKREQPYVMLLEPGNVDAAERAAYDASYKGVTDILTLYMWRKPAFYLTRWAALAGMTPNQITLIGFVACVAAFFLFWNAWYWTGMAVGLVFMVLDTVDGKLARCTGQSSKWGNVFDHGIDLIHPPFWWWAWAEGLKIYGRPFEPVYEMLILGAIVGGYVTQRIIEGIFMRRYGMHIHVWQQVDSRFRLITARRNPNMVILFVSMLFARPDIGIEAVALWTIVSLIFHWVRLVQANARRDRGQPVISWLA